MVLEREVIGSYEDDERAYRSEEWRANYFAIWLRLPDDRLEVEFVQRFGKPPLIVPSALHGSDAETAVRPTFRILDAASKVQIQPSGEEDWLSPLAFNLDKCPGT